MLAVLAGNAVKTLLPATWPLTELPTPEVVAVNVDVEPAEVPDAEGDIELTGVFVPEEVPLGEPALGTIVPV
jgi:hypothetical protein